MKLKNIFKKKVSCSDLALKVKRGELAKEFEMIRVAKDGDVGIDVPVALPCIPDWEPKMERYLDNCMNTNTVPSDNMMNEIQHGVIVIKPGERYLIPTDIKLEIPKGYWVSIEARSSTSKQSLIVPKGVIDEGYRGELFAQIINVGKDPVIIRHGDRLIQLILHKRHVSDFNIVEVDELATSERGESGFGSSGKTATKIG